jgi:hypothetical protein
VAVNEHAQPAPDGRRLTIAPRWVGFALGAAAVGLLPWAAWILLTLPDKHLAAHWRLAWTGFDVGLALALAATATAVLRSSPAAESIAMVTATLLVCDAWFDCLTAEGSKQLVMSLLLAFLAELPLALVCVWIARHAELVRRARPTRVPSWRDIIPGLPSRRC